MARLGRGGAAATGGRGAAAALSPRQAPKERGSGYGRTIEAPARHQQMKNKAGLTTTTLVYLTVALEGGYNLH